MVDFQNQKYNNIILKTTIIAFIVLAIIFTLIFTYYTIKTNKGVVPDPQSKNRIETLNQVFASYFGNNWPFVMLGFAGMLILFLILLYFLSWKDVNLNISDSSSSLFYKIFLIFIVIYAITMICLVLYAYKLHDIRSKQGNNDNYLPYEKAKKTTEMIFLIVVLLLITCSLIGGGVWYFYFKK